MAKHIDTELLPTDAMVEAACAAMLEALKPAMMAKFGGDAAEYQKTWADATEDERAMFLPAMRAALSPSPQAQEKVSNCEAELRHWFFQKLNSDQREGFLAACGYGKGLVLGLQYQAVTHIADRLSKPVTEANGMREALVKAVRSFRNAATEFRRAKNSGEAAPSEPSGNAALSRRVSHVPKRSTPSLSERGKR